MAKRGDELREHILWSAKDVFLEMGFERASMDVVAARSATSKRSLYAHYESKENLFLAVIDFARGLFLDRLKMPADYSDKPADALALFCGHYLEMLTYEGWIRMCRMSMAEATRFPQGAAQNFELLFTEVNARLTAYLKATFRLTTRAAADAAQKLMGHILYPRFQRALFGMDVLATSVHSDGVSAGFDMKPIRKAVADLIEALPK